RAGAAPSMAGVVARSTLPLWSPSVSSRSPGGGGSRRGHVRRSIIHARAEGTTSREAFTRDDVNATVVAGVRPFCRCPTFLALRNADLCGDAPIRPIARCPEWTVSIPSLASHAAVHLDHRVAHPDQPLAQALRPQALGRHVRALEQQR